MKLNGIKNENKNENKNKIKKTTTMVTLDFSTSAGRKSPVWCFYCFC